jgi:hypothetical protein
VNRGCAAALCRCRCGYVDAGEKPVAGAYAGVDAMDANP